MKKSRGLYLDILIFITAIIITVYSNVTYLFKSHTELSEVLKAPKTGQVVEFETLNNIGYSITSTKGLFHSGLFKTYYYAVAVQDGDKFGMIVVRGTESFRDIFKDIENTSPARIKGSVIKIGDGLREAVAKTEDRMNENAVLFGNGYYVDTLIIYKLITNICIAAVFLVLTVLSVIALRRRKAGGGADSAMAEKLAVINTAAIIGGMLIVVVEKHII